jgi:hypothetical protein
MRKRLVSGVFAAVFMLVLPVWSSPSSSERLMNSAPFATIAMAGHITPAGFYCDCNGQCGYQSIARPEQSKSDQNDGQANADATPDSDLGAMMVIVALLVYFGMRA